MNRRRTGARAGVGEAVALTGGFSLYELVTMIAVIGVVATVLVRLTNGIPANVKKTKLEADVATLNQLIGLYVADGGRLDGATSPQAVLDRLKTTRVASDLQRHTGPVTGRLVDNRLRARMGSGSLTVGQEGRAVWNAVTKRFEIVGGGASGVEEFYLDDSFAGVDYGSESRTPAVVKYNSSKGWIWGTATESSPANQTPTYIESTGTDSHFDPNESSGLSGPGSGGGSSGGSGGGGGGGASPPEALPTPIIEPDGGSFAGPAFPTTATIDANDPPAGRSELRFRINGGAWQAYTSGGISIASGDTIEAQNRSLDTLFYTDSGISSQSYYRLIADFSGDSAGSWTNVAGGSGLIYSIASTDTTTTLTHGNTRMDLGGGQFLDAGVANVLSFTESSFASAPLNEWFKLGDVTILNGNTFYNSEASAARLELDFTLNEPAATGTASLDLGFISTENTDNRMASADIVELKNPVTDFSFTLDGVTYTLEVSWVSLDPSSGVVQGNQLLVFEGASASAELRGRFVANH